MAAAASIDPAAALMLRIAPSLAPAAPSWLRRGGPISRRRAHDRLRDRVRLERRSHSRVPECGGPDGQHADCHF